MSPKDHTYNNRYKEILEQALALPTNERKLLSEKLHQSVRDEVMASPKAFMDKLVKTIRDQYGYDIRKKNKTYPIPFLKSAFIYTVRRKTVLSRPAIARYLNMNSSSILTAERRMEDIIANPHIFKKEIQMYNTIFNDTGTETKKITVYEQSDHK